MSDMRLIVAGAGGRMGRTLVKAIAETPGLDARRRDRRRGFAAAQPGFRRARRPAAEPRDRDQRGARRCTLAADAILDFTVPAATVQLAALAAETHLAHIIGTTGMSAADDAKSPRPRRKPRS